MGPVIVEAKVRARREAYVRALVDTGFYGDVMVRPETAAAIGVELKHARRRTLPDGRVAEVRYGIGEIEVMGEVTGGDIEVWEGLRLPQGVEALLGVTALEKMGLKVDPTGRLERTELYLL